MHTLWGLLSQLLVQQHCYGKCGMDMHTGFAWECSKSGAPQCSPIILQQRYASDIKHMPRYCTRCTVSTMIHGNLSLHILLAQNLTLKVCEDCVPSLGVQVEVGGFIRRGRIWSALIRKVHPIPQLNACWHQRSIFNMVCFMEVPECCTPNYRHQAMVVTKFQSKVLLHFKETEN